MALPSHDADDADDRTRIGAIVRSLAKSDAYPGDGSARSGVEQVETHISHVFLTGRRVYKLRKAVRFGFLDFSTLETRHADCLHEVQLNRRLAEDAYLGVAPVERSDGRGHRVGRIDEFIASPLAEHCVVMRRLPPGQDAESRLRDGRLSKAQIERIARRVARFHEENTLVWSEDADSWRHRIANAMTSTLREMEDANEERGRLDRLGRESLACLERLSEVLDERRRDGRIVDGHGDLRLEHVWLEEDDAEPVVIDCVEFSQDLRRVDSASDVAFLSMDLRWHRREDLAEHLLREYASAREDPDLPAVVGVFEAYRSAVRAKVAHLKSKTAAGREREELARRRRDHLDLASESLGRRGLAALP